MSLDQYYLLGRSGLRVSPFALGTLTFGTDGPYGAWGSSKQAARAVFDRYLAAGGNFIDTADLYTRGTSESLLGEFIADGNRDRLVLTSKYSYNLAERDPNAGGNGRKNMIRALEASLKRLRTDYLDLYLLHTWDRITPAEEVVRAFDDLVRAGKIRYAGLSDVPAWYAARAHTYAEAHALAPIVNLQLQYSLVERGIEAEFTSLATNLGMGITAWSPLASGLLSGKYRPNSDGGSGRLSTGTGKSLSLFTERNWQIVGALEAVAGELGRSMAQVALQWVLTRPGVTSVILGATRPEQLEDNLGALDLQIPPELLRRLDEASAPPVTTPYAMFGDRYQAAVHGAAVSDRPPAFAPPVRVSLG
ncbi:aldo/keto reductase [Nannocystis sp. ILAH1]|uniref:aldo/keto reductase n=1 Tax=unclassified Nannocystis TaxID=2627009 RepID=UPI0022713867|nr:MULTISPECIES: aldo/keto reductase [unclassified Nannocystis]MCY0993601.1 aldo/keto reductase [Nannocystis sp. ILAH1]MCY1063672.1 aldo/keto reductase [Nannocystis sp. RBIL2]